ncbi:hypothetical protein [Methylobacterium sp. yr596]|uniref:hypothetical protein n=1 Tax=Methylobacterium sp. yr596 TaxID=1761800 RepID=UPI0008E83A43|nr:hypothetical protein [Methylobacterium sp. yr596]SFE90607.1 hypothetical protein SAMN04487844_107144 [Methylobacterium sp. yr596]
MDQMLPFRMAIWGWGVAVGLAVLTIEACLPPRRREQTEARRAGDWSGLTDRQFLDGNPATDRLPTYREVADLKPGDTVLIGGVPAVCTHAWSEVSPKAVRTEFSAAGAKAVDAAMRKAKRARKRKES